MTAITLRSEGPMHGQLFLIGADCSTELSKVTDSSFHRVSGVSKEVKGRK